MGYPVKKENNKYFDYLIETYLNNHFGLSLVPAQIEVLKVMLTHDYVLFRHGRGVGSTFLLAVLSTILRLIDPGINMAVASTAVRQANFINSEVEKKFSKYNLEPLNVVTIEEALSGKYNVLLLDDVTNLLDEYVESLIKHIEDKSISKIVSACCGYRRYYPVVKLERCMYSGHRKLIVKNYEDMPSGFFALDLIEEAKKVFDYPEEFNMEYKGHII